MPSVGFLLSMNQTESNQKTSARSPFAGCVIMIIALLVMVFLVVFSVVTLFRQYNEISKFTAEKPAPVAVSPLDNREAELNSLAERIESFRQKLTETPEASLALTPEEMNLAIAAYEQLKDLQGTFRILSIEGDTLRIGISFQLNGKPRRTHEGEKGLVTSDPRYLNGTLIARPGLLKREIVLKIENIEVPGAVVPREFIEQMSPYRITERYLNDTVIGPAMANLTHVCISDGKVVFSRVPGETPTDLISNDQVDTASRRLFTLLGIGACAFLLFAGIIVFFGLRAKATGS